METWNLLISKRIRPKRLSFNKLIMVGAEGFEPPTLCSQSRCATRLRYAPTLFSIVPRLGLIKTWPHTSAQGNRMNVGVSYQMQHPD